MDRGEENGGDQGVPTTVPTATVLPMFNTMAMFCVQPGRSYHSVQVSIYSSRHLHFSSLTIHTTY